MKQLTVKSHFDVIVIGGGGAGLSAALWCDELGLQTLLLESAMELGGQLLWTYNEIKNHLGVEARNGRELRDIFLKQISARAFEIRLNSRVKQLNWERKSVTLENEETFFSRATVIATGIKRRRLDVEGERKFQNKGIIQSGKRQSDSVKDKRVVVIGGGDAAFENALILAESAAKVFLIHRGASFRARSEFTDKASRNPKIEILSKTMVRKFVGENQLEAVEIQDSTEVKTKILKVDAAVIRIGVAPNTQIFRGKIALDQQDYIKTDSCGETNVENVFAVGDASNPTSPTVSSAVGSGATAAKTIFARLKA